MLFQNVLQKGIQEQTVLLLSAFPALRVSRECE